jgi:predicted DCC family thiol-disulfide oxidoreductase YuxK
MNDALHSYRQDPAVPAFPDDKPVFIFDGVCVFCSRGVRQLHAWDKKNQLRFMPAQSPTGQAIYRHYGITMDETYLLLDQGRVYVKSDGYMRIFGIWGAGWNVMKSLWALFPRFFRDYCYGILARNRYAWFGKTSFCAVIPPELKSKLLM